jgi:hypothetical protein
MSINSDLATLYHHHWETLQTEGTKLLGLPKVPASPLLLQVDEDSYQRSDLKVLIFGQETWGWGSFNDSLQVALERYTRFYVKEDFYNGYKKSSFWKAFRIFKRHFSANHKDKHISYVWNNISKIGINGKKGVTKEIRQLERNTFPVIQDELAILNPDYLIFLTGPNRDHDIRFHLPDVVFNNACPDFPQRQFSIVQSSKLPENSIRMYHPSYFGGFSKTLSAAKKVLQTNRSE